ncbi:polyketide cyclase/dehydrase/lipid transport protein [Motilibacter peucedani]|uniref:Polyketide cyclase/dehydrase/lipid transport protein n=1 Tax=Motilibacter peucedani TaxID=598650 RepID=A0A420XPC5_9ACTN|nr:SRPBCC family protein [Motilibacter peucedani]RKS74061.1 polyketide cyclase/dehydrase/lipid transport protein [Motilibacter peucedani]
MPERTSGGPTSRASSPSAAPEASGGSTEASTRLEAPVERVLAAVTDLERYPEWNDELSAVEVLALDEQGRPARARLTLVSPFLSDTFELAYSYPAPHGGVHVVSWVLVAPGAVLTRMDGSYLLADGGDGTTGATYRLRVGVSVPLVGALRRKAEKTVIDRALDGLRKRVEESSWD